MARSKKANKNSIKVDFTGVESSGQVAEGRQLLTVKEVEVKTGESSGSDYLNWKFGAKGGVVYHTTSLLPHALWNLRNVLEGMGMEVPESSLDIDLTEFPDMQLGAEIEHEKYQGKKKPVIVDIFPVEELEEGEDEEGEDGPDEDEGEDITYADVMAMDKDELIELAEEEEIKLTLKVKKKLDILRDFIADKLELEDDEEEDEPAPKKTTRKSGSKTLKKGAMVKFTDDGEEIEGKVLSVNTKESFAVIDVEGEEWEVELEDISL